MMELNNNELNYSEIIAVAWKKFWEQSGIILGMFLLSMMIMVVGQVLDYLTGKVLPFPQSLLGLLLVFPITALAKLSFSYFCLGPIRNINTKIERFFDIFPLFPRAFFVHLCGTIFILLGLFFFIVPGIILYLGFSCSTLLVLDKKTEKGAFEVLKLSWEVMKGYKWNYCGFVVILLCLNVIGFLCFIIGLFVSLPLSVLASIEFYRRVIDNYEKELSQNDTQKNQNTEMASSEKSDEASLCHT